MRTIYSQYIRNKIDADPVYSRPASTDLNYVISIKDSPSAWHSLPQPHGRHYPKSLECNPIYYRTSRRCDSPHKGHPFWSISVYHSRNRCLPPCHTKDRTRISSDPQHEKKDGRLQHNPQSLPRNHHVWKRTRGQLQTSSKNQHPDLPNVP